MVPKHWKYIVVALLVLTTRIPTNMSDWIIKINYFIMMWMALLP